MEMSCRTSSYFSSIDNGVSSKRCFIFTRVRPSIWRTARAVRESPQRLPVAACGFYLHASNGIYLLLEGQLPHPQVVDPLVAAGNALLEESIHLALDVGPFPRQLQPAELDDAIGGDQHRGDRLPGNFGDQPSFLCT